MSTAQEHLTSHPAMPDGKRRLIRAALKLGVQGPGFSGLGIRELAREAGLNPNTFYRHFENMEDLAQYAAREVAHEVMDGMRKVREASYRHADATEGAAKYFLAEVQANPDAFRMGLRELHSGPARMRRIMQKVLDEIAQLSVEQIQRQNLVPSLAEDALFEAARNISYYMIGRSLDILDQPQDAKRIQAEIVRYIRIQFLGALALQG